ncbi:MAG TPA: twin-arginine translocase TatA/TatE family subunit [Thermodesulfobacteriota bacterium]|nr:twin-arginine translocase TatA/TatE family subunit [Thermodesulfobacteriota bacterium]
MFGLGTSELILILLVVFVIFGAGKLPELGSGLGKAIKNFKRASSDADIDITPEKDKLDGDKAQKKT